MDEWEGYNGRVHEKEVMALSIAKPIVIEMNSWGTIPKEPWPESNKNKLHTTAIEKPPDSKLYYITNGKQLTITRVETSESVLTVFRGEQPFAHSFKSLVRDLVMNPICDLSWKISAQICLLFLLTCKSYIFILC